MTHLTLDTQGAVLRPDLEVFSKSRMSNGNMGSLHLKNQNMEFSMTGLIPPY